MYKHGLPVSIIVDENVPVWKDDLDVEAFARNEKNCWVQILEKAYSKLHGYYEMIASGNERSAMRELTGAPGWVHNP